MNVIKLIIFGVVGFCIFSVYDFIISPDPAPEGLEEVNFFGPVGMFVGFGLGVEFLEFDPIKSRYFMTIIGTVCTFPYSDIFDFNIIFCLVGSVVGFYYRDIIDIGLKS